MASRAERVQVGQAGEPAQHGDRPAGPRDQPQPGLGDDGQGAFRPGQQRRVVVAGVVLDQAGQVGHDGAVGQHGLEAAQLGAHRPVAQHPQPARVGGHRAAHGGAVPAGDEDAEVVAGRGRPGLAERHPGPRGDLRGLQVRLAQPVQPGQAEHDFPVQRDTPADQPGVAALRNHRHPGAGAQGQHRGDLRGVPRPHDRGRVAPEPAGPVHRVARGGVAGQHVRAAHHRREVAEQGRRQGAARGAGHRGYRAGQARMARANASPRSR